MRLVSSLLFLFAFWLLLMAATALAIARLHRHRYHGVLAPNSPQPPQANPAPRFEPPRGAEYGRNSYP